MSCVRTMDLATLSASEQAALLTRRPSSDAQIVEHVRVLVDAVRDGGDAAILDHLSRFDGVDLPSPDALRVSRLERRHAVDHLDPALRQALDTALRNIMRYHATQVPQAHRVVEVSPGVWCGERWAPIDSVCLYVPRGRGAFASVACMLGAPAKLAGVPRIVLCTPPGPDGTVDAATLAAADMLGIDEVYRIGGAAAVAAAAFGTPTVAACDKFVGPGNVHVCAARQILAGVVDTGPDAGPSEALILADATASPANVAWNLMVEAEHGDNSCALLLTHDRDLARRVAIAAGENRARVTARRRAFIDTVLSRRGGILLTPSLTASIEFANRFAAEHVALMVADPWSVLGRLRHAGEVLLGDYPIFSLANYAMGVNAILPTGGRARTASGVSVADFGKKTSIGWVSDDGFAHLRDIVPVLSRDEGFSAHHEAVLRWQQAPMPTRSRKE